MKEIKVAGKIEFLREENKCYNRTFVARLEKSSAFQYGNGTCVIIEFGKSEDGRSYQPKLIDTRYEQAIDGNKEHFKWWLENWFEYNYQNHRLIFE